MTDEHPLFPIPTAFVDNWEILHTDVHGLIEAQNRSAQFCQTWKWRWTFKRAGLGPQTGSFSRTFNMTTCQNQSRQPTTLVPSSGTWMRNKQTCLQKPDSKMPHIDYVSYPNCTYLWAIKLTWLWPQCCQNGDIHVKARSLTGKNCTTCNETLWTQSGNCPQLDRLQCSLPDQTDVWPCIVGLLPILPCLRGMFYFHSTSREDLLSVWNHWVERKSQLDKLNKVPGTGPVWIFLRFLIKFEFDVLPNGEISCNQRHAFIFDEDREWS